MAPSSLRGRRVLAALVLAVVGATVTGLVLLWPPASAGPGSGVGAGFERIKGTVTAAQRSSCSDSAAEPDGSALESEPEPQGQFPEPQCISLAIHIDEGPEAGETFETVTGAEQPAEIGQGVVLYRGTDESLPADGRYQFADVQRAVPLLALTAIFLLSIPLCVRLS